MNSAKTLTQLILLASLLAPLGCAKDSAAPADDVALKALVQDDLDQISKFGDVSVGSMDSQSMNLFRAIFKGTNGVGVRAYIDERIRHFFSAEDASEARVSPAPVHTSYQNAASLMNDQNEVQVGASNVGTGIWFQGAVDRNVVTVSFPRTGESFRVTDPRVGLMLIGPGYTKMHDLHGDPMPGVARQAILVHEARHSDCTGGVSQTDLDYARSAANVEQFTENYPALSCGHMHVICPAWHDLAGYPACDKTPWGAYAIEMIFARAAAAAAEADGDVGTAFAMTYMQMDAASRLLYLVSPTDPNHAVEVRRLLNLEFGNPDMSSGGVRE